MGSIVNGGLSYSGKVETTNSPLGNRIVFATDASMCLEKTDGNSYCIAYVDSTGRYIVTAWWAEKETSYLADINALELYALAIAFRQIREARVANNILIAALTDSENALIIINRWLNTGFFLPPSFTEGTDAAKAIVELYGILKYRGNTEVLKVRAHSTHPLNLAADTIAMRYRRAIHGGTIRPTTQSYIEELVRNHVESYNSESASWEPI